MSPRFHEKQKWIRPIRKFGNGNNGCGSIRRHCRARKREKNGFWQKKYLIQKMRNMEIIDSHHHFWHYDPVTYEWIDDRMAVIQRDFLPEHFKPVLQENRVSGTIAVQADSSVAETHFLLETARSEERR